MTVHAKAGSVRLGDDQRLKPAALPRRGATVGRVHRSDARVEQFDDPAGVHVDRGDNALDRTVVRARQLAAKEGQLAQQARAGGHARKAGGAPGARPSTYTPLGLIPRTRIACCQRVSARTIPSAMLYSSA